MCRCGFRTAQSFCASMARLSSSVSSVLSPRGKLALFRMSSNETKVSLEIFDGCNPPRIHVVSQSFDVQGGGDGSSRQTLSKYLAQRSSDNEAMVKSPRLFTAEIATSS